MNKRLLFLFILNMLIKENAFLDLKQAQAINSCLLLESWAYKQHCDHQLGNRLTKGKLTELDHSFVRTQPFLIL